MTNKGKKENELKKYLIKVTRTNTSTWVVEAETPELAVSQYTHFNEDTYEFIEEFDDLDVELVKEVSNA